MNELRVQIPDMQEVSRGPLTIPLVVAQDLRRSFWQGKTEVVAVADASCSIHAGARIAITGRSGSGKSTLLHLLGGVDRPSGGAISWPALGAREQLRPEKVAMVFQSQSLLAPLNALENVELPLLLNGIDKGEAQSRARVALEEMQLDALAHKLPEELSGGQAQQVALARALAYRPPLILADEPTGQLDHATAQRLLDLLLRALEKSDTALVISTHDLHVAEQLQTQWSMDHGVLKGETL